MRTETCETERLSIPSNDGTVLQQCRGETVKPLLGARVNLKFWDLSGAFGKSNSLKSKSNLGSRQMIATNRGAVGQNSAYCLVELFLFVGEVGKY